MDSLIGEMVRDSFGATGTVLRYDPDFRYYVLRLDNSGEMVRRTSVKRVIPPTRCPQCGDRDCLVLD